MPKDSQGQKTTPAKSKMQPRQRPEDAVSRAVHTKRDATNQEVGDTADRITRAS